MGNNPSIRLAQSCLTDARKAAREFYEAVKQPNMELVIFFCSSEYDLDVLADEMKYLFTGIQVVGCTTAGEIGPAGYRDHSLTGVSFSATDFKAVAGLLTNLQQFQISKCQHFTQELLQRMERQADTQNSFAFLLIDGLSIREEPVTRILQSELGKIPLVGGSAGDSLNFNSTYVYFEGHFHSDSAIVTLVTTKLPFKIFKTQHFIATEKRLVVTEADTTHRRVKEINGLPAAQEYARILGIDAHGLDPMRFAASPIVVMIDGTNYVRSIQKANSDGSLTFFCAIENGLVLRVAKGVDLLHNLEENFGKLRSEIGPPQLVLGCDCILRKLEVSPEIINRINDIFQQNNTIGFNTYGEQFRGVHVNQTLVGVAIGSNSKEVDNV
ncbi:FIST C-terminal domain-containing protein [Legionella sp. PATHC038]|uniref:nitric oxide-sensing protein NosP n=1 Tax=Legionella sheltonii TaxID=2992041 RepID=UPI002243C7A1|nr:nitric oxide-sensing protein NosP [Legionella sp. PATHC038]MCW8400473.1 FIST C-terminal domain-containing protein [Legionella sp. PATHC038]